MSWRVESRDGLRWMASADSEVPWEADSETTLEIYAALAVGVAVYATPSGPAYEPTSAGDEGGAYLLALDIIHLPRTVFGEPPTVDVDYELPEGATP